VLYQLSYTPKGAGRRREAPRAIRAG
jgi:hypothetical protein